MHPTVIIQAFRQALEDAVAILGDEVGVPVDMDDEVVKVEGRRIRELTSIVQKRFNFPEGSIELYAKKV